MSKIPTKTIEQLVERACKTGYAEKYTNSSYYGGRRLTWQIVQESQDYYVLYHYGTKILTFKFDAGIYEIMPGAYSATDQTAIQSVLYLMDLDDECHMIKRHGDKIYRDFGNQY